MDSRVENERVKKAFENAVWSTYSKYSSFGGGKNHESGINQAAWAIKEFLQHGETKFFSNYNGGRDDIKRYVNRDDIARYLSSYIYNCAKYEPPKDSKQHDLYWKILLPEMLDQSNREDIIENLNKCLSDPEYSISGIKSTDLIHLVSEIYTRNLVDRIQAKQKKMLEEASKEINPKFGINNLETNWALVNWSKEDVKKGGTKYANYNVYGWNELMGSISEGEDRHKQEDSVLLLYHPKNPKYKFLAVADGMGGLNNGGLASNEALRQMVEWFESLPTGYFADVNNNALRTMWANKLQEISDTISMKYGNAGTTFTGAIAGDNMITIASVGDSRGYVVGNDNKLYQLTDDDTKPYEAWKAKWDSFKASQNGKMRRADIFEMNMQKDALRFDKQSRFLTGFLGKENTLLDVHMTSIGRSRCKLVMLCTNGMSRKLYEDEMLAIIRGTDDPRVLGGKLINAAMNKKPNRPDLANNPAYDLSPRNDDMSVAYWKNTGQERNSDGGYEI